MGFRDRFFTPATAKALLSWRILLGIGVGVVVGILAGPTWGVGAGIGVYVATVMAAMPSPQRRSTIDPFTISEPWRHFVQGTQRARSSLHHSVNATKDGPLKSRLTDIAGRLEQAVEESWAIARRGDDIDAAVNRIDPVRLRSQLATLTTTDQAGDEGSDRSAAVASIESQLASADRLKALSASTADRLRLTQARIDELVARAAEVSVGTSDTDTYEHDVDNLVVELEGLRLAIAETNDSATGTA
jgi:hypothetical protein